VTGKEGQGQRLMLQDLKGGQAIELSKASIMLGYPRWSPDGSELTVFLRDTVEQRPSVFLIPRLGGSSRFIGVGGYTCWSPDGSHIAVALQSDQGFKIVDKVTGSVKSIPLSGFQWFHDLDWSPASNLLAVLTSTNGRFAIWTVHPDGSQARKVIEEDWLASPRWSATGDGIYFLHGKGDTAEFSKLSINPRSGEGKDPALVLMSGLEVGSYFTVSMNGTRLAYSRSQTFSNLWLAEFQGPGKGKEMQTRPLTRGTTSYGSLSMSPDGKWIAFSTGRHIYKMPIEGGTPIQLTFSDAHACQLFRLVSRWQADRVRLQ
jgi:Tol biopolymer transport system component